MKKKEANKDQCKENLQIWRGGKEKEDRFSMEDLCTKCYSLSVPQSIKALYVYTALKKSQKKILNEFIALAFFDFF